MQATKWVFISIQPHGDAYFPFILTFSFEKPNDGVNGDFKNKVCERGALCIIHTSVPNFFLLDLNFVLWP